MASLSGKSARVHSGNCTAGGSSHETHYHTPLQYSVPGDQARPVLCQLCTSSWIACCARPRRNQHVFSLMRRALPFCCRSIRCRLLPAFGRCTTLTSPPLMRRAARAPVVKHGPNLCVTESIHREGFPNPKLRMCAGSCGRLRAARRRRRRRRCAAPRTPPRWRWSLRPTAPRRLWPLQWTLPQQSRRSPSGRLSQSPCSVRCSTADTVCIACTVAEAGGQRWKQGEDSIWSCRSCVWSGALVRSRSAAQCPAVLHRAAAEA